MSAEDVLKIELVKLDLEHNNMMELYSQKVKELEQKQLERLKEKVTTNDKNVLAKNLEIDRKLREDLKSSQEQNCK